MARKAKAVSSQGTRFFIQNIVGVGTAKTITGISKANPAVVTATVHGLATGDVVALAAIVGMVELNGTEAPIKVLTANTFELVGVNSTDYTAWTSGGTATPFTFVESEQHKSYNFDDPGAAEQDVTTMVSDEKEFDIGLPDPGTFTADMHFVETDLAHIELETARSDGLPRWFKIKKRNGYFKIFYGSVKSFNDSGAVDGRNTGSLSVRVSGKKLSVV